MPSVKPAKSNTELLARSCDHLGRVRLLNWAFAWHQVSSPLVASPWFSAVPRSIWCACGASVVAWPGAVDSPAPPYRSARTRSLAASRRRPKSGHEDLAQRLVQRSGDRIDRRPYGSVMHDPLKVVGLEHDLVEPVRQHECLIAREPDGDRFLVHALNLAAAAGGVLGSSFRDQHAFQLWWWGGRVCAGVFTCIHGQPGFVSDRARGLA